MYSTYLHVTCSLATHWLPWGLWCLRGVVVVAPTTSIQHLQSIKISTDSSKQFPVPAGKQLWQNMFELDPHWFSVINHHESLSTITNLLLLTIIKHHEPRSITVQCWLMIPAGNSLSYLSIIIFHYSSGWWFRTLKK